MAGFTLMEVLVVVFLIGIIAGFASLSISQNTSRTLEEEAERLYALLRMAGEEAVLMGEELAMQFTPKAYRFVKLEEEEWRPLEDDKLFREREIPAGVSLELVVEGVTMRLAEDTQPSRIMLLSSGEMTPFELVLSNAADDRYVLRGTLNGELQISKQLHRE
jgi:general secretion pathway protein H